MLKAIALHEGVIRPSLVEELQSFRAPGRLVSSYYLDLDPRYWGGTEAVRVAVKNTTEGHRERLKQLEAEHPELLSADSPTRRVGGDSRQHLDPRS